MKVKDMILSEAIAEKRAEDARELREFERQTQPDG